VSADDFRDGWLCGVFVVLAAMTLVAIGHWIGRTNAEKRFVELSKKSHLSERMEAKEPAR
jgi:membrane protein DedA with SNARE-associated domain